MNMENKSMRVLLVADGRSPTTRHWLKGLADEGLELYLVSTFPCDEDALHEMLGESLAGLTVIPVAFSRWGGSGSTGTSSAAGGSRQSWVKRFRGIFLVGRYRLGPLSVRLMAPRLRRLVAEIKPDLVHALRIPFEGMLAGTLPPGTPLVVSTWGNDLTFHAQGSKAMRKLTLQTLHRANGLMADTRRDLRLGRLWGFDPDAPTLSVPGAGGLDLDQITTGRTPIDDLPADVPLVLNPRGLRPGSVRTDTFFQSIPGILQRFPNTIFVCPAMAGQPEAIHWVQNLHLEKSVRLLPPLPQPVLWDWMARAQVTVSVSVHDGTPNSLLEAMSLGCLPVTGDIESLREWITPGVNGLLVDPGNPGTLSAAVIAALEHPDLRNRAAEHNLEMIRQRADVRTVMPKVTAFYREIASTP
jgi:hypothetical protein